MALTEMQQICLDIIAGLNKSIYAGWFWRASIMAIIEIESSFDPQAYRAEPRLNDGSYGLMQLLGSTARGLGYVPDDLDGLFDPETNISLGMKGMRQNWDRLARWRSKSSSPEPTLAEWASAWNWGVYAVITGRNDSVYADKWAAARARWVAEIGEG